VSTTPNFPKKDKLIVFRSSQLKRVIYINKLFNSKIGNRIIIKTIIEIIRYLKLIDFLSLKIQTINNKTNIRY
jgi:hypothetical protein